MPQPISTLEDSFTRANESPIRSPWSSTDLRIVSNLLASITSTGEGEYATTVDGANDIAAGFTFSVYANFIEIGLFEEPAGNGYLLTLNSGSQTLTRVDAGRGTVLGASFGTSANTGDTWVLRSHPSGAIEVWRRRRSVWTLEATRTDSAHHAGKSFHAYISIPSNLPRASAFYLESVPVLTLETVGHSLATGDGVTTAQRATGVVAAALGMTESNHGVEGAAATGDDGATPGGWADLANDLVRTNTDYTSPIARGLGVVWYGMNDVARMANNWDSRDQELFTHAMRFALSRMVAGKIFNDSDSSISYSGFTQQSGVPGTGGTNRFATVSRSTVTIRVPSDFPGGTVAVYLGSYIAEGASWTFTVDAVSTGGTVDATAHGQVNGIDSGIIICQRFTGLSAGAHTIVLTAGSIVGHAYFDSWAIEAATTPSVLVPGQYTLDSTGYAYFTGLRTAHTPTDSDVGTLNTAIRAAIAEFPSTVRYVGLSSLDGSSQTQADHVHPTSTGHATIATLMQAVLSSTGATIAAYDGSAWTDRGLFTYNGSAWVQAAALTVAR